MQLLLRLLQNPVVVSVLRASALWIIILRGRRGCFQFRTCVCRYWREAVGIASQQRLLQPRCSSGSRFLASQTRSSVMVSPQITAFRNQENAPEPQLSTGYWGGCRNPVSKARPAPQLSPAAFPSRDAGAGRTAHGLAVFTNTRQSAPSPAQPLGAPSGAAISRWARSRLGRKAGARDGRREGRPSRAELWVVSPQVKRGGTARVWRWSVARCRVGVCDRSATPPPKKCPWKWEGQLSGC